MIEEFSNPFLPPAVIVHGLSHAIRAVASALPVTLLSAPGAGAAWGCLWWQELLAATGHHGPALLDCAASPGRAAEALAIGLNGIVLTPGASWSEIAALAAQSSALLLPKRPTALDLGLKRNERRLIPWLGG